jgi:hypothetical protein
MRVRGEDSRQRPRRAGANKETRRAAEIDEYRIVTSTGEYDITLLKGLERKRS